MMWGGKIEVPTGYLAKMPIHSARNEGRVYHEVKYLAGLAHLARHGRLALCDSAELQAERFRQPHGRFACYGFADHNVFKAVRFENLDGFHLDFVNPPQTQIDRIDSCSDPLFRSLLAVCGQQHSLDAYHIFAAERFGLFAFLHLDFTLARTVEWLRHAPPFAGLKTRVLLPSQLRASAYPSRADEPNHSWRGRSVFSDAG